MDTVNVLWTGGLDSTFRICELSRLEVNIQPYYIIEERKSENFELRAIQEITNYLRHDPNTKATILDLKTEQLNTFPKDNLIEKAWCRLREKYLIGSQYEYLANFAKHANLILEVGLECSPRSKAYNALTSEGKLKIITNSCGCEEYMISMDECSEDLKTVFGNFRFPRRLFESSKLQEIEILKDMGLGKIVGMTWFCHTPIWGYPCGRCNPCKDALNEGLSWRVPVMGRFLGIVRGIRNKTYKILKLKK